MNNIKYPYLTIKLIHTKNGKINRKRKSCKRVGDAKNRQAEEEKPLQKKQNLKFKIVKIIILLLLWGTLYFYNPAWYIVIIFLLSLMVIGTKASLVREIKVD